MVSVGIDIGTFSVKVAEVSSSGKAYEIIRFDEYSLSQDPTKDNEIEILEILREVSGRYAHDQTRFNLSVRNDQVSLRRIFYNFRERHKFIKTLPFELEDEIPFSMEDAIFDARITRYLGGGADVLAVACPKEVIQDRLQVAQDGQMRPETISVDALAFANLFEPWSEAPPEHTPEDEDGAAAPDDAEVVINMGHSTSTLIVLRQGVLLEARTINWGGRNIAEAISRKYSIHFVEALKEMRAKAFILLNNDGATRDQVAMSDLVKKSVDDFSHALALTLLELRSEYNLHYTHCALVGGVSLIRNLGPYITQTIEVPTNRLAKIDRHPELNFATNANNVMASITAIGLALEGIKKPKNPAVNLLKDEFASQGQSMKIFMDKWGHTLKVAAAMFVLFFVWSVIRDGSTETMANESYQQLRANAKKMLGLKRGENPERKVKRFVRDAKKKQKNREMLASLQNINSALDVLNSVTNAAPPRVKKDGKLNVRSFRVNNRMVRVEGEMRKAQDISKFKTSLQGVASGPVKEVPTTIKASRGYRAFHFEFEIERQPGGS